MFSILIPSYNNKKELVQCLNALQNLSTEVPFICKVCIDGSNDTSYEEVVKLKFNFNIEILQHSVNKGRAAARNTLLKSVTTKYILFLDSDTIAHPNILKEHLNILKNGEHIISIGTINYSKYDTWGTYFQKRGKGKFANGAILNIKYLNTGNVALAIKNNSICNFNEAINYGEDLIWGFDLLQQNEHTILMNNSKALALSTAEKKIETALAQYGTVGEQLIPYIEQHYPQHNSVFAINKFTQKPIVWLFQKKMAKFIYAVYKYIPFPFKSTLINYLVMNAILKGYKSAKKYG